MKRFMSTTMLVTALVLSAVPAWAQEKDLPAESGVAPGSEPVPPEEMRGLFTETIELTVAGRSVDAAPVGQEFKAKIVLRNAGEDPTKNVVMTLVSPGDNVNIIDGTASFGDIDGQATASGSYTLSVAEKDCVDFLGMEAKITYTGGDTVTKVGFPVECPGARLFQEGVRYVGGDGDQVPEPGERLQVFVMLRNHGRDAAKDAVGTLTMTSGEVTVVDGSASWPAIAAKDAAENTTAFVIDIADGAKTAEPCQPFDGGVIVDDRGDDAVSSDGTVSSDGNVSSGGGGSSGSGSTPSSGSDAPTMVAPVPPAEGEGAEGSEGTTTEEMKPEETTTDGTEPGTIEPDRDPDGSDPEPRPIEPGPGSEEYDPPVPFDARLIVKTADQEFDASFGSGIYCALADYASGSRDTDDKGAPAALDSAERTGAASQGTSSGAAALAAVVLAMVASLAIRFRFNV